MERKQIVILGESLDKENFPKLYNWASGNPETLVDTLRSLAKGFRKGSISSAMQALESDLEHGQ